MENYSKNTWKPVKHSIIKDADLASKINEIGYSINNRISSENIEKLTDLFENNHRKILNIEKKYMMQ
jgi:hypothetical protein